MFCCGGTKVAANQSSLNEIRNKESLKNIKMKLNQFDFEFNPINTLWSSKIFLNSKFEWMPSWE